MENRAKGKNFMENIDFEPCRAKLFLDYSDGGS